MAFPDYGPIDLFASYTQQGLERGGFLFQLIAGQTADGSTLSTMGLHYIAIAMALIGAVILLLSPHLHKAKYILSWLFLVFLLIVFPTKNTTFFTEIENVWEENLKTPAFTPQVVAIDILSRIHVALFSAFFTIDSGGSPIPLNLSNAIYGADSFATPGTTFESRPDLQHEMYMYNQMCGTITTLLKAPYDENYNSQIEALSLALTTEAEIPGSDIPRFSLSFNENNTLASRIFSLKQVLDGISDYQEIFAVSENTTFPPFAIFPSEESDIDSIYGNFLTAEMLEEKKLAFKKSNASDLVGQQEMLSYAYITYEQRMTDNTDDLESLVHEPSIGLYKMTKDGLFSTHKFTKSDRDPLKTRILRARISEDQFPNAEERTLLKKFTESEDPSVKDVTGTPVQLAIMTPALYEVTERELLTSTLTEDEKLRSLYVVSNCKQFHAILHRRLKESIVVNSGWRKHPLRALLDSKTNRSINLAEFPYDPQKGIHPAFADKAADYRNIRNVVENVRTALTIPGNASYYADNIETVTRYTLDWGMYRLMTEAFASSTLPSKPSDRLRDTNAAINKQLSADHVTQNFKLGGTLLGKLGNATADWATGVVAFFSGATAAVYIKFLIYMVAIAIFFILLATPLLMLIGIMLPSQAPGIILTSVLTIVVLKTVPITFMLVDFTLTYAVASLPKSGIGDGDQHVIMFVMAIGYTSIVAITMYILFAAGDTERVVKGLAGLDKQANQVAENMNNLAKAIAVTGASMAVGGVAGGVGAFAKSREEGGSIGAASFDAFRGSIGEAKEVFTRSSTSIPIVGDMMSEVMTSHGEAQAKVSANNALKDAKVYRNEDGKSNQTGIMRNAKLLLGGDISLANKDMKDAALRRQFAGVALAGKQAHNTKQAQKDLGYKRALDVIGALEDDDTYGDMAYHYSPEARAKRAETGLRNKLRHENEANTDQHIPKALIKNPDAYQVMENGVMTTKLDDDMLSQIRDVFRDDLRQENEKLSPNKRLADTTVSAIAESLAIKQAHAHDKGEIPIKFTDQQLNAIAKEKPALAEKIRAGTAKMSDLRFKMSENPQHIKALQDAFPGQQFSPGKTAMIGAHALKHTSSSSDHGQAKPHEAVYSRSMSEGKAEIERIVKAREAYTDAHQRKNS